MLAGRVGDVNEADFGGAAFKCGKQGIEYIIANISAGGVGYLGRNTCPFECVSYFAHGQGGKISGFAICKNRFVLWLVAVVVRDGSVAQINTHKLRRDGAPTTGLTDAKDRIRMDF